MNFRKNIIILLLLAFNISSFAQDQLSSDNKQVDDLLTYITSYEYGKDDNSLSEFSELVKESIDNQKKSEFLEKKIIKTLELKTTSDCKQFLCEKLSIIGTEESVDILSKLSIDPETNNMARYALEKINSAKVDKLLIELLDETDVNIKIGSLNSLGKRKSACAVEEIKPFLEEENLDVFRAASASLGKIATVESASILKKSLENFSGKRRTIILDNYLLCADEFFVSNNEKLAKDIYNNVYKNEKDITIKKAAFTGVVKTSDNLADLLLESLNNDPVEIKTLAAASVKKLTDENSISKIAGKLKSFSPELQVQIIYSLRDINAKGVNEIIVELASSGTDEVKAASLVALRTLGSEKEVIVLAKAAVENNGDLKKTAQESLDYLSGAEVNNTILGLITDSKPAIQTELIRSVGERQITSAYDEIFKTAKYPDRKVRVESYKTLSVIAEPDKLSELIDLFLSVSNKAEIKRMELMLARVSVKIADKSKRSDLFLEKINNIDNLEIKKSFLRIIGRTGDPNSLIELRKALNNSDIEIVKTAIQGLTNWPNLEPKDDLLNIVKNSDDETLRILAHRGFIDLIGNNMNTASGTEFLELYKTALELAETNNEKRMIISGLAKLKESKSIPLISDLMDDDDLYNEAEVAAIEVAGNAWWSNKKASSDILEKLVVKSKNEKNIKTAKALLQSINQIK
ncbi:MAG: HEAT repeat domain-containing protein [Melioribacteraceae bacterium]|nr:HEAT repeat domain-containing protein [Melioribacteraceae bacterium]